MMLPPYTAADCFLLRGFPEPFVVCLSGTHTPPDLFSKYLASLLLSLWKLLAGTELKVHSLGTHLLSSCVPEHVLICHL